MAKRFPSRSTVRHKAERDYWFILHGTKKQFATLDVCDGWVWTHLRKRAARFDSWADAENVRLDFYPDVPVLVTKLTVFL